MLFQSVSNSSYDYIKKHNVHLGSVKHKRDLSSTKMPSNPKETALRAQLFPLLVLQYTVTVRVQTETHRTSSCATSTSMFCRYKESCLSVLTIAPLFTQRRMGLQMSPFLCPYLHTQVQLQCNYSVLSDWDSVCGRHTSMCCCSVRLKSKIRQTDECVSFYGCFISIALVQNQVLVWVSVTHVAMIVEEMLHVSVWVSQRLQVVQVVEGLSRNGAQLVVLKHPGNKRQQRIKLMKNKTEHDHKLMIN